MKRGVLIGVGLLAALAALGALAWRLLGNDGDDLPDEVQWPFDRTELQTLMDRVVADQRETIGRIEDAAERARAEGFLKHYEGRRAAV